MRSEPRAGRALACNPILLMHVYAAWAHSYLTIPFSIHIKLTSSFDLHVPWQPHSPLLNHHPNVCSSSSHRSHTRPRSSVQAGVHGCSIFAKIYLPINNPYVYPEHVRVVGELRM